MLAYGEARVEILMRSESHQDQALLGKLLEFWSTYIETLTDEVFSNAEGAIPWASTATSFVLEAVSNAWQRIIYPDATELSQWDNSDRIGFIDVRKDVADLLQSTYALTGSRLLVTFADLLISAVSAEDWARLEAAAFCLGSLADCAKEELQSDEALSSVFSSPLFNTLRGGHALLPPRVRQTCVGLIEKYTEFFERHTELLPPALNLLFSLVGDTMLSQPVSRSILRLCSSCRHHLHSETGAFLEEYQRMNASQTMECEVAEKVLGGIASVAQALEIESERLQALRKIVGFVEIDLQTCQTLIASSNAAGRLTCPPESRCLDESCGESPALHIGIRVLRCLSSVAKAFQIPAEMPVEIDAHSRLEQEKSPQLANLQRHIFDIIVQPQRAFPLSVEVVDNICSILRSGFSETEHGPFVFPPRQIAEYLFSHTTHSPRIGALVKTACSFTSSLKQYGEGSMRDNLLADLFTWAIGLLRGLPGPETDPELSHNAIDFITRVLSEAPQVLLDAHPLDPSEFFFLFTLQALDGKEPLPKMASAGFWAHFLQLAGNPPPVQHRVIELMKTLGPLVSESLMRNFGGNASRSELDKLSEPLKKLITWYPAAPGWLESALEQVSFPGSRLNPREKTIFVKKLVSTPPGFNCSISFYLIQKITARA
ncbi:Importin beta-like protein [Emericellopsis cladophorae]|uniref:Importin beta-like protein n=1 Tax=Emericellopsis cladophorae TaxID=2686198 RepID=A0A9Q0B913_9HYPO|nr:Importin beta-like protein [Emericellopsis cladophorae]KAI6778247.1 Importin beta-like protein [Emericellopsis cladophorae]